MHMTRIGRCVCINVHVDYVFYNPDVTILKIAIVRQQGLTATDITANEDEVQCRTICMGNHLRRKIEFLHEEAENVACYHRFNFPVHKHCVCVAYVLSLMKSRKV